jgi:hypothetical protein
MKTNLLARVGSVLAILLVSFPSMAGAEAPVAQPFAPPLPSPTSAAATHTERNGQMLIPAVEGKGGWERFEEDGFAVIRAVRGESMTYRVRFQQAGIWYVHLRCRLTSGMKGPDGKVLADHSTNDAHVTVGGVRLHGSDRVTRPEGIRCHGRVLDWWSLPKGPGSHTPDAIRDDPVMTYLPEPGVYEVVLRYRSPGFVVHQIAFTRAPNLPPQTQTQTHTLGIEGTSFTLSGEPFAFAGVSFFNAIYNPSFNRSSEDRLAWI